MAGQTPSQARRRQDLEPNLQVGESSKTATHGSPAGRSARLAGEYMNDE